MSRLTLLLLVLATAAPAGGPADAYKRGKAACVAVQTDLRWGLGVVLLRDEGLVLAHQSLVPQSKSFQVLTKRGLQRAKLLADDTELGLALLHVENLKDLVDGELKLAPALLDGAPVAERRVYALGKEGRDHPLKFAQGITTGLRVGKGARVKTIAHDAQVRNSAAGGPLLDAGARLLGISAGDADAIPVNAIRLFLKRHGHRLGKLPPNAIDVTVGGEPDPPRRGDRGREPEPVPEEPEFEFEAPEGLRYAPYVHTIGSREKRSLQNRAKTFLISLAGVHYRCPRCKGSGTIPELVRDGYYDKDGNYFPPVYRTVTCPRCNGARRLFSDKKARSAFGAATRAERGGGQLYDRAVRDFVRRIKDSGADFLYGLRYSVEVKGRYGIVKGPRRNRAFPFHFKLLAKGKGYEWFLHDMRLNGPFAMGIDGNVPTQGKVIGVPAADMLALQSGEIVRICGIAVPGADGKLPKTGAFVQPNEGARKLVEQELLGKTVSLRTDKYSQVTCGGLGIAFVAFDGKDYGVGLIERGIVRRHPKHIHMRNHGYKQAETAAKKAKVGIWKK